MNDEIELTESVMSFVSKSLRAKLPPTRKFFMVAIPVTGCASPESVARTDCAHDPKGLAKALRSMANYYDPQN